MIVRWLGAYGKQGALNDSLCHELSLTPLSDPRCAEHIKGNKGFIAHASVGLLVANRATVKRFSGDVYSTRNESGMLRKNRSERAATYAHSEVWVRPDYKAVVIKSGHNFKKADWQVICNCGLPVLRLTNDGRLSEVKK